MNNLNKTIGDMKILKEVGYKNGQKRYVVECLVCGHTREVAINNLRVAGNKHCIDTCKEDYYLYEYEGKVFGDYKVIGVEKGRITMQCTVCGCMKECRNCDMRDRYHSQMQCREYYFNKMIGETIGDFKIVDYMGRDNNYLHHFKIRCSICKRERVVNCNRVIKERISHSDCSELIAKNEYSRNLKQRYENIIQRTTNPNNGVYEYYGERGIKCEYSYFVDFYDDLYISFVNACGTHGINNVSLDRIDNSKGYEKGNVRWTIGLVQQSNTRRNRHFIGRRGDEIVVANNAMVFGRYFNINGRSVGNCLRGTSKSTNGWVFEEISKEEAYSLVKEKSVTTNLIVK